MERHLFLFSYARFWLSRVVRFCAGPFPPSCSFFFRWHWKQLPKSHKRSHSINSVDQNGIRFAHFSLHLCCTFELPCLCGISPPPPIFGIYDTLPSKAYPAPSFYLHWFCVFFFLSWFSASFPFLSLGVFLFTCSRFHIFSIHVACCHFFAVRRFWRIHTVPHKHRSVHAEYLRASLLSSMVVHVLFFVCFYIDVHTFARRSRSLSFLPNVAQVC